MRLKGLRWAGLVGLLTSALLPAVASADTTTYQVRGSSGAVWAVGDQPGTEFIALACSDLVTAIGSTTQPGPRITFSMTRWSLVGTAFVRRQWYGDVPLKAETLKLGADLAQATLEAEVLGSLEERTVAGVTIRRDVPGRIQIRWTPNGVMGLVTASYIYQTPAYIVTLQTSGQGRTTMTTATVQVEALGGTISVAGFGTLTGTTTGNLIVGTQ